MCFVIEFSSVGKMILFKFLGTLMLINAGVLAASTPESETYVAAVVEYQVDQGLALNSLEMFKLNANKYIEILTSTEVSTADIVVFPENTLNRQESAVVIPAENQFDIDLCADIRYEENLRAIACAARNVSKYVVINLTTKRNCADERAQEGSAEVCSTEWNLYNTNVVLDRDGVIISVYRKFNLFGEKGITRPSTIEYKTFSTDFGVTFGHFICFDLLFESPAVDLVRNGITNIIFPTRWYSSIPFLTGVQIQQNWAHTHKVNLLAAGANLPSIGTGGSGIYSGQSGALASVMTGENTTKVIVHEVPKAVGSQVPSTSPVYSGANLDDLLLYQEDFEGYRSMYLINALLSWQSFSLCSTFKDEQMCCNFFVSSSSRDVASGATPYTYMAIAYNGWRNFNDVTHEGVKVCAVVACLTSDIATCGKRFNTSAQVNDRVFSDISISVAFPATNSVVVMPSTLDFNLSPLLPSNFNFEQTLNTTTQSSNVRVNLSRTSASLLTFGFFARDFRYSSSVDSMSGSILVILTSVVVAVFHNVNSSFKLF